MNFNQIVRYSLEYLNQSRYYHWQTESYAHHEALGEFYNSFSESVDKMVEAMAGRTGVKISIDQGKVELVDYNGAPEVIESLEALRTRYEEFKESITDLGYIDIEDIIDDIVHSINELLFHMRLK
mgnify:FL=1|jgi:DNA-binding ferritin-like protein|tara:strand:- start:2405 stop:2779 length:375 start_codon:yes stop_codon:yes gene_type:complete